MHIYYWIVKCKNHMEAAKLAGNEESFKKWWWAYKRMQWKAFLLEKEKYYH